MGKISVGKTCLLNGAEPLELDGIQFRSDMFQPNQYLAFVGGRIVTMPGAGGASPPTRPYRIVNGQVIEYDTIQQAIDSVPDNADDIIFIPAGDYPGTVTVPQRSGTLILCSVVPYGARLAGEPTSLRVQSRAVAVGLRTGNVEVTTGRQARAVLDSCDVQGSLSVAPQAAAEVRFSRVGGLSVGAGSEALSMLCWIGELSGDGSAVLHDTFLGRILPGSSVTVRHSGGLDEPVGPSDCYTSLNIPWQTPYRSVLVFDGEKWGPEPYSSPSGLPRVPFIVRDGQYLEFSTVQEALAAARAGETVWLPPGVWTGGIHIGQQVSLCGIGSPVILLGNGQKAVIEAGVLTGVDIRKVGETDPSVNAVEVTGGLIRWCRVMADYQVPTPSDHTWAAVLCSGGQIHSSVVVSTSSIWHADAVRVEGESVVIGSLLYSGWANSSAIRTAPGSTVQVSQSLCVGGVSGPGGTVRLVGSRVSFVEGDVTVISDLACVVEPANQQVRMPFPAGAPVGAVFVCSSGSGTEVRRLRVGDLGDVAGEPRAGDVLGYDGTVWRPVPAGQPGPHAASHQDGGIDEIRVDGLSGRLSDYQKADQIGPWPVDLQTQPSQGSVLVWDGSKITWGSVRCELLFEAGRMSEPGSLQLGLETSPVPV